MKLLIALILIVGAILAYYYLRITPLITDLVVENTRMKVSKAIDDMTDKQLQSTDYEDFVITRYDNEGDLTFFQVNGVNVDLFARKVTAMIREEMTKFEAIFVIIVYAVCPQKKNKKNGCLETKKMFGVHCE